MSIRAKYSLLTAALIGAVVSAVTASVLKAQRAVLEAESRQRLEALMDGVERIASEALEGRDDLMLVSYLMFLKRARPEVLHATLTRRGHTSHVGSEVPGLVYLSRGAAARRPVTFTVKGFAAGGDPAGAVSVSSGGVTVSVPGDVSVRIDEERPPEISTVRVGFLASMLEAELDRALRPLLYRTVGLGLAFMALGSLGALGLGKLLTGPLTALTAAVGKVERGELDATVEAGRSDEVGILAQRFNAMTARIRELLQWREDVLHTLTHELNTPLAGLKGYLELWQARGAGPDPAARRQAEQAMLGAVLRMESSLSSALGLFRSEAAAPKAPPAAVVWIDEFLREAVDLYAPVAQAKGIAVEGPAGDVAFVCAPAEPLRQIVSNLVSNALKYTPEGGRVSLGVEESPAEVRFWVRDTGRGIPAGDLPHIFTKFYRAGPGGAERIPGTGLGLSIAKRAADGLGGRLWAESEPGRGTTFHVAIPKSRAEGL